MSTSFYITDSAGSMVLYQIPSVQGLVLTTDPGGRGGISWVRPPAPQVAAVLVPSSSIPTPSNQVISDLSVAMKNALAPQVQTWVRAPVAIMVQTGRVVTLQVSSFEVVLGASNFTSGSFLPLPVCAMTQPISRIDGDAKGIGLLSVLADGSLQIWPELMTNVNAWDVGTAVVIDGFVVTYVAGA